MSREQADFYREMGDYKPSYSLLLTNLAFNICLTRINHLIFSMARPIGYSLHFLLRYLTRRALKETFDRMLLWLYEGAKAHPIRGQNAIVESRTSHEA